jgi:hypothetical protein
MPEVQIDKFLMATRALFDEKKVSEMRAVRRFFRELKFS